MKKTFLVRLAILPIVLVILLGIFARPPVYASSANHHNSPTVVTCSVIENILNNMTSYTDGLNNTYSQAKGTGLVNNSLSSLMSQTIQGAFQVNGDWATIVDKACGQSTFARPPVYASSANHHNSPTVVTCSVIENILNNMTSDSDGLNNTYVQAEGTGLVNNSLSSLMSQTKNDAFQVNGDWASIVDKLCG